MAYNSPLEPSSFAGGSAAGPLGGPGGRGQQNLWRMKGHEHWRCSGARAGRPRGVPEIVSVHRVIASRHRP